MKHDITKALDKYEHAVDLFWREAEKPGVRYVELSELHLRIAERRAAVVAAFNELVDVVREAHAIPYRIGNPNLAGKSCTCEVCRK